MTAELTSYDHLVAEADRAKMHGWDFTHLAGRWQEAPPSWDYRAIVSARLPNVSSLLDMGTGGGEFLSSLAPLPPDAWATEGYPPNVPIARSRLEQQGIKVVEVSSDLALPFADSRFDLVINRHESFSASEVHRILRPGGVFITQQVGGQDNRALNQQLQEKVSLTYENWNCRNALDLLANAGFTNVDFREEFPLTRFFDVGAIIQFLKATPWQIDDFNVDRYASRLRRLHDLIQVNGLFETHSHRFYIEARKT